MAPRGRPHSLTARLTLIAAIGALPVLLIAGAALLWLFADRIEKRFDAFLSAYQQQLIAAVEFAGDGSLTLKATPADPHFDLPFSGWYWQISAEELVLAQSTSAGPLQGDGVAGLALAGGAADLVGPANSALRGVARDVRLPGSEQTLRVLVAGPHAEIDQEVFAFGLQLGLTLVALGLAFLVATSLQVRYGLQPLRALRDGVQGVREGAAPRLAGRYPAEVSPLVEELNAVLSHNETLIDRARVQAGNLAHGLKSPLTVLRHELSGVEGEKGAVLRDQVAVIGDQVERVLARIRAAGPQNAVGGQTDLAPALRDLAFSLDIIHRERGIAITIDCPDNVRFAGDAVDLSEMLGNLMDNACKWARRNIQVTARSDGGGLSVAVDDDGPGIPPADRAAALARGSRLDEAAPGSGLGLDIVREIAALYRGELSLGDSPLGGLRAGLRLPGA